MRRGSIAHSLPRNFRPAKCQKPKETNFGMAQRQSYSESFQSEFGEEDTDGFPDWPSQASVVVETLLEGSADLQSTRDYSLRLRPRRQEEAVPARNDNSWGMEKGEIEPGLPHDHGSAEEEPEVGFVMVTVRHSNLRHIHWGAVSHAGGFEAARPSNHILGLDACGNLATTLDGIECYPWLLSLDVSQNDLRSLRAHRLPFTLTHIDLSHNVLLSLEVSPQNPSGKKQSCTSYAFLLTPGTSCRSLEGLCSSADAFVSVIIAIESQIN